MQKSLFISYILHTFNIDVDNYFLHTPNGVYMLKVPKLSLDNTAKILF